MRIFKICTKKDRGPDKKAMWPEIGVVFENDKGQLSGYLNNAPGTTIYLFEQKKQDNAPGDNFNTPPAADGEVPF